MRKHLLDLGRSDIPRKDAAHTHALSMNLEHDACGCLCIEMEKTLQDVDDELHRGEVIVHQKHLEQARRFGARSTFPQKGIAGTACLA